MESEAAVKLNGYRAETKEAGRDRVESGVDSVDGEDGARFLPIDDRVGHQRLRGR